MFEYDLLEYYTGVRNELSIGGYDPIATWEDVSCYTYLSDPIGGVCLLWIRVYVPVHGGVLHCRDGISF